MLDTILDYISNIIDLLYSFFSAVGDLLHDIAVMVVEVGKAVLYVPELLSWLPMRVIALLTTAFTVVVCYKILGREG